MPLVLAVCPPPRSCSAAWAAQHAALSGRAGGGGGSEAAGDAAAAVLLDISAASRAKRLRSDGLAHAASAAEAALRAAEEAAQEKEGAGRTSTGAAEDGDRRPEAPSALGRGRGRGGGVSLVLLGAPLQTRAGRAAFAERLKQRSPAGGAASPSASASIVQALPRGRRTGKWGVLGMGLVRCATGAPGRGGPTAGQRCFALLDMGPWRPTLGVSTALATHIDKEFQSPSQ